MKKTGEAKGLKTEGGLHTRGEFHKSSEPGNPLISIITVVYNGEQYLEQTINSVINQTYKNIEYIIIDGASTDGTLDIVRKYEDRIAYWLSEPDKNLYDAMNKGSRIASGDYLLYINSDDYLYSCDSVKNMLRLGLCNGNAPLLLAGRVLVALNDEILDWVIPISEAQIHKDGPHLTATFISSKIYNNIKYNTLFNISGDIDYWNTIRRKNLLHVKYVDTIVSVFRLNGVSNSVKMDYYRYIEREISKYNLSGHFSILILLKNVSFVFLKRIIIIILGKKFYYKYVLHSIYVLRRLFFR